MNPRLKLLLGRIKAAMAEGKSFDEAVAGYRLTAAELEELREAAETPQTSKK